MALLDRLEREAQARNRLTGCRVVVSRSTADAFSVEVIDRDGERLWTAVGNDADGLVAGFCAWLEGADA